MTNKGGTWFNGVGVIADPPGMQTHSVVSPAASRTGGIARAMLIVGGLSTCTALVLIATPAPWAWESLRVIGVGILLLSILRFRVGHLKPVFVIWWLVLVSECIFFRETGSDDAVAAAFKGSFPTAAYGEVVSWTLCLLTMLLCLGSVRSYFSRLFAGDYKWLTLFAMACVGSCIYAPRPAFALVWGFKLTLVVLLLLLCSTQIQDVRDIVSFLRFTFFAYVIVVLQPVIISMFRGQMFDEEGRMSMVVNPDALSADAGAVFVLALTLFSRVKNEGLRITAVVFGATGFVVMILAGGKAAIVSGLFAGALFFLLRKGFGSTLGFVVATAVAALLLASFTPLGDYFLHYGSGGNAATLSGRTLLWSAVIPAILQKPILGHGYVASTFIVFQVNQVIWAAPQLHNGFLEASYNNGFVGLLLILMINIVIPRNLYRVLRRSPPTDPIYRIGAGCLALYALLLINGFFNASFGGRARPPFILLLSLVLISDKLVKLTSQPIARASFVGN
jgi:O-antigen ligase